MFVVHLDGQLSATIEASRRQIDRAHDGAGMVGKEHLGVQFKVPQFMNLDTDILHGAHAPNGFNQLTLFELVWRSGHDVNFYSAACRPDQPLNNDSILIPLVLQEDGILRGVNKLRDAFSPVAAAPD